MKYDETKLTAYVLGELDGCELTLSLDEQLEAEEIAMVAGILSKHLPVARRRRIRWFVPQAIAASILFAVATVLFCNRLEKPMTTVAPTVVAVESVEVKSPAILRLTFDAPAKTRWILDDLPSAGMDVEQLVAAVLQDASRVGEFSSLRLASDPLADLPVAFQ